MIRILFVLNGFISLGGTEKVVENIFDGINKELFHIDFMLHCRREQQTDNSFFRKITNSDSKVFYVTPRYESFLKNRQDIYSVLKKNTFDIIHTHMDAPGAIVLYYARKCGYKVRIAHSHNTEHQISYVGSKRLVYNILENAMRYWIRREATSYIACSTDASLWLFGKTLTNSGQTNILMNSIDAKCYQFDNAMRDKVRKCLNLDNHFVIGTVGRICEQKNTKFLIEIMKELVKITDQAILLHVGPGDASELSQLAETYQIKQNVIFYGQTENVKELLDAMDVFVLPSLWEGLGIAGLEAQANGLPIVLSTSVPEECAVINYKFVDLKTGAGKWAEELSNIKPVDKRKESWRHLSEKRYDQAVYMKKLEEVYLSIKK